MLHSGWPVVLFLVLLGLAIFTELQPGWFKRAALAIYIAVRAWLDGYPLRDVVHIAQEQSDPQWAESHTVVYREPGFDPWEWDEPVFDSAWRRDR